MASSTSNVFWFRRDLRLHDNHGLWQALKSGKPVQPIFIFDRSILARLRGGDRRVGFIHAALGEVHAKLRSRGSGLHVYEGEPEKVFAQVVKDHHPEAVHFNEDYEPYAVQRDGGVRRWLEANGVRAHGWKDQVLFAKGEVAKEDGLPYRVFTPYSRRWKARALAEGLPKAYPSESTGEFKRGAGRLLTLADIGFGEAHSEISPQPPKISPALIKNYKRDRDRMDLTGTTHLGVHLRFGTLSVRDQVRRALKESETWLGELIWREFFMQILHHFPHTVDQPYDRRFHDFPWRENDSEFARWQAGETGYPVVDAGMRELNETGFMHNRARMVTASFLCKHLLIDWRRGERDFADKLMDYDLSANVGNWQWVAGSGCDAAPYFRIFNPALQAKKFDPVGAYVKRWVPEFGSSKYPDPIVDHEMARRRALIAYEKHVKPKER